MFLNFSFSNDAVGYIVDGVMDTPAIEYLRDELLKKFEEHKKISLYLEDSGIDRFNLNSVVTTTLFPHKHRNRFHRVAMVTDRKWIHLLARLNGIFLSAEVKNFTTENRLKAIAWIEERD
ncbi:MAG: STAS/SEC14 domain-containing protein [Flavobacteriaceae bacterium]|nr:STAS/SEC14 domain-containing protein [Flavobacteriaceae bacterium]